MRLEGEREERGGEQLVGRQGGWGIRGSGHQNAERTIAQAGGRKTERGAWHCGANDVSSWRESAPPLRQSETVLSGGVRGTLIPSDTLLAAAPFSLV